MSQKARRGQSDFCLSCGKDLKKAKKSGTVRYWISYYIPDGRDLSGKVKYKQRRELVGISIKEARDAAGKRGGQKRENRFSWDMLAGSDITFNELAEWYLNLEKVRKLSSYDVVKIRLNNFNEIYGSRPLTDIRLEDLENY